MQISFNSENEIKQTAMLGHKFSRTPNQNINKGYVTVFIAVVFYFNV